MAVMAVMAVMAGRAGRVEVLVVNILVGSSSWIKQSMMTGTINVTVPFVPKNQL